MYETQWADHLPVWAYLTFPGEKIISSSILNYTDSGRADSTSCGGMYPLWHTVPQPVMDAELDAYCQVRLLRSIDSARIESVCSLLLSC